MCCDHWSSDTLVLFWWKNSLQTLQVILQLLFIQDVSRRRIASADQVKEQRLSELHQNLFKLQDRSKPGRQIVTFLLICNLSIWVIYTFEVQKVEESPVQVSKIASDQHLSEICILLEEFM